MRKEERKSQMLQVIILKLCSYCAFCYSWLASKGLKVQPAGNFILKDHDKPNRIRIMSVAK